MANTQSPHTGEQDDPCEGGRHCCCCGPYEPCCDCGQLMPSKACIGERCWCGAPAAKKIGEEILFDDPMPNRHNLTAYVCAAHYAQVMGPSGAQQVGLTTAARQPEAQPRIDEAWCPHMAELEGDAEIGAGALDHPLRCQPEAMADQSTEARLRELIEKATPGWSIKDGYSWVIAPAIAEFFGYQSGAANADLAVAAVNALPSLLDELTRLRAELEAMRDAGLKIVKMAEMNRKKHSSWCHLPAASIADFCTTLNGEQANG